MVDSSSRVTTSSLRHKGHKGHKGEGEGEGGATMAASPSTYLPTLVWYVWK